MADPDRALTDVVIDDARWEAAGLTAISARAAEATLRHLDIDPSAFEIAVLGCDDTRISGLNADFRDKSQATNVLSWPSEERAAPAPGATPTPPSDMDAELGDIAISYDTCAAEALAQGKSLADHTTHLMVHGVLHLLGYDHIRDEDATLMETTEVQILGKLGIASPY
ncbi:rRNA maturation RNase YbeY [Roseovarius sp. LXJ103]|uniref:rRNA maturation RNase YbeY n=1 Tax=Roseovarius carneus TaxID=2853164 RepID=UPI000D605783|nr:rRNA maturation RNase YbeY [Roseovarius carneus]MBZ8119710.1 rRNA maturation RNase YbeY [Roseovarius carneus]PWE34682.1 rRNA maturation RNase YbeY [Pelagicola sp. LXJ1103]